MLAQASAGVANNQSSEMAKSVKYLIGLNEMANE